MTDYLTEQEQVEILKRWIKQYSLVIFTGILLAILMVSGWRFWQQRQLKIATHASHAYDEMINLRAQNNSAASLVQAHKLTKRYANTVYGPMAALMIGRDAVIKKNYAEAEKQFSWVMDHSRIPAVQEIARLRLARILLMQRKPQDALALLQKSNEKSFAGFNNELQGDAYLALNNPNKAREAYHLAITTLPNADAARPLLQMKYDSLTPLKSAS